VDRPDRRRRPGILDGQVEGLPTERRGETGSRPDRPEVEPDEVDLAAEAGLEPSLRRAGQTGSTENAERATGQLAGGR
jgi:hypothetical protein